MMAVTAMDPVKVFLIAGLFAAFLSVQSIIDSLGSALDTIPMRFAAMILILGSLSYDPLVSLAVFMVIAAIYIEKHQDDLSSIASKNTMTSLKDFKSPKAMDALEQGGYADESMDSMDFTSHKEDQEDGFHTVGKSIDEKHALQTEPLGSKSQGLFPDELKDAESLMRSNARGSQE
jgi:hypothetical protein